MDSLHEAHLDRILENRRRRGVLGTVPPRRGSSVATYTRREAPEKVESSTSPLERGEYAQADRAALQNGSRAPDAAPSESPQSTSDERLGNVARESNQNGNGAANGGSSYERRPPRFEGPSDSYGRGNRSSNNNSYNGSGRWGRGGSRRDAERSYRSGSGRAGSRSPQRTIPLLTYSSPDASSRAASRGGRYRSGSDASPRRRDYSSGGGRGGNYSGRYAGGPRREENRNGSNGASNGTRLDGPYGNGSASSEQQQQQQQEQQRRSRADEAFRGFPDENQRQPAGSVIYTGNEDPFASPQRRRPPGPPLPGGSAPGSPPQHNQTNQQQQGSLGLPVARTTMDIRTSVSILAAGDWFYKWSSSGSSVGPRWVWIDTQSYLLLWAHKETRENAFAGTIKLEKIIQITTRELQQPGESGAPQTYYILLVETNKRVLQLGTERRLKADTWYEALNNVLSYIRSQTFATQS